MIAPIPITFFIPTRSAMIPAGIAIRAIMIMGEVKSRLVWKWEINRSRDIRVSMGGIENKIAHVQKFKNTATASVFQCDL